MVPAYKWKTDLGFRMNCQSSGWADAEDDLKAEKELHLGNELPSTLSPQLLVNLELLESVRTDSGI